MTDKNKTDLTAIRFVARLILSLQDGITAPELPEGIGWRDVYRVSRQHSVCSAVYEAAEEYIRATGDEALILRFDTARSIDFAKHAVQSMEYERILSAFSSAGISHLAMKGFTFKALWTRPECRSMADLDFYTGEYTERAGELLVSLGYKTEGEDGHVHDSYEKPPYVKVELHKRLYRDSTESFDSWVFDPSAPCRYEMKPADFYLFALRHMYKHHKDGGFGIRTLFDMYLYEKRYEAELVEGRIEDRLAAAGLLDFYKSIRELMGLWFDGLDPECASEELLSFESYVLFGGTYGNEDNRARRGVEDSGRTKYMLSRLFPSYADMCLRYKWLARIPILLPVAYIMRFFSALFGGRLRREMKSVGKANKE